MQIRTEECQNLLISQLTMSRIGVVLCPVWGSLLGARLGSQWERMCNAIVCGVSCYDVSLYDVVSL